MCETLGFIPSARFKTFNNSRLYLSAKISVVIFVFNFCWLLLTFHVLPVVQSLIILEFFSYLYCVFPFPGKHLAKLNITPSDTRDSEGLSRFHPYNWYITFFPGESNNYYSTSIYPVKCCSSSAITFQVSG